jgi:phosphoribosylanthranilate isomerase
MPVDVKICGLSTPETVMAALDGGADLIGFVFYPKSPRNVSAAKARELARAARGRARIVALIVDAEDGLLDEIVRELDPDLFQAHGSESPERIATPRAALDDGADILVIGRPITGAADPAQAARAISATLEPSHAG